MGSSGSPANLMAASQFAMASGSLTTSILQSSAMNAKGKFDQAQYEENAGLAELQAQNAILRGDVAAGNKVKQTKQVIGAQRTALASQGIDVSQGSALELQYDTRRTGELDAVMIKNNAWQEAWGYKMQALNYQGSGMFAKSAASYAAGNTILTGGLDALGYGAKGAYYYSENGKSPKTMTVPSSDGGYGDAGTFRGAGGGRGY